MQALPDQFCFVRKRREARRTDRRGRRQPKTDPRFIYFNQAMDPDNAYVLDVWNGGNVFPLRIVALNNQEVTFNGDNSIYRLSRVPDGQTNRYYYYDNARANEGYDDRRIMRKASASEVQYVEQHINLQ